MATIKRKSKARVYIYRTFILSILAVSVYGAYEGYMAYKPVTTSQGVQATVTVNKELQAIQDSAAFKLKIANLAEQQLISDKIEQKKAAIAQLENEVGTLKSDLEAKRVASLSL